MAWGNGSVILAMESQFILCSLNLLEAPEQILKIICFHAATHCGQIVPKQVMGHISAWQNKVDGNIVLQSFLKRTSVLESLWTPHFCRYTQSREVCLWGEVRVVSAYLLAWHVSQAFLGAFLAKQGSHVSPSPWHKPLTRSVSFLKEAFIQAMYIVTRTESDIPLVDSNWKQATPALSCHKRGEIFSRTYDAKCKIALIFFTAIQRSERV